jgi:hypothetical protein
MKKYMKKSSTIWKQYYDISAQGKIYKIDIYYMQTILLPWTIIVVLMSASSKSKRENKFHHTYTKIACRLLTIPISLLTTLSLSSPTYCIHTVHIRPGIHPFLAHQPVHAADWVYHASFIWSSVCRWWSWIDLVFIIIWKCLLQRTTKAGSKETPNNEAVSFLCPGRASSNQ